MTLQELVLDLRAKRAAIRRMKSIPDREADTMALLALQTLYDRRLVLLARMLDVPTPLDLPSEGGLYADHRLMLEDRVAEAGADLR